MDWKIWTGYKTWTRYKTRTADCGLRTGYKIATKDYFGKNGANWFQVRKNKSKRSLNSKTHELKL